MSVVALDLSPLKSGHAGRGVGTYTRLLYQALQNQSKIEVTDLETSQLENIDLIHYPYFDLFFPSLPLLKRKPTIVTIHDVIPLLFPKAYPKGKRGWLALMKQRVALQNVKAIITDSEASKRDICRFLHLQPERVHVVYLAANPLLTAQPPAQVERVRKTYHIPQKYVLYVGDINYNKNVPQLIKSLKFLPEEVQLVCVGRNFKPHPIPEWQAIETQLALSNVADRVVLVDNLPSERLDDLSSIYTGAICYVQPSLAEGFGLPVLEAMQCQTPVVATRNSSLVEVAATHGVLVETDAESLAKGIQSVIDWSQTERQKKIRAALTWSKSFSWQKTARETVGIYQEVLRAIQLRKSA